MKIALAQINTTVGAFEANAAKIWDWTVKAREKKADVAVFPELALCGYPPLDLLDRPGFRADCQKHLERLAASLPPGIPVITGTIEPNDRNGEKPAYNAAVVLHNRQVLSRHYKTLLPTYDVFDEARYFQPAPDQFPWEWKGTSFGILICEDAWNDDRFWERRQYREDPVKRLMEQKVDFLLSISASPYTVGKQQLRAAMLTQLAERYERPVAYLNLVGGNDSLVFDGGSFVLDAQGNMIAKAAAFQEDLLLWDTEAGGMPEGRKYPEGVAPAYEALVLGLKDYCRKTGFEQVVIGLSGGIDSALTAVLAARALGPEKVLGVAMPSRYSSKDSLEDAEILARNLEIGFRVVSIEPMFRAFLDTLAPVFEGRGPDTTEENLQARVRGNILMAISNKEGRLVLSTGNKSELAVGYCTLYGDMAGGLAVISDVPKMMVYELSRHINREWEVIPRRSLEKAPSAELRPDQKDEDSLPPYPVLDPILRDFIEEGKTPEELVASGHDPVLVRRIVGMIYANEYKRRQAAPGLKITQKAFGLGRRFPIAQSYRG